MHRAGKNTGAAGRRNRLIKSPEEIINKTFVQMMEALGYDIELTYVKR